jgi:hypothetical protein
MAKAKIPTLKDLSGYLFLGVQGSDVNLTYHDATEKGLSLASGLASAMEADPKLFDIISTAVITHLEEKEKYNSKTAKKPVKTATKSIKKK